jgi:diaminohydroxyphosphoribosylaminopyrimidine deaminase / 5-amino-6-(5-phosphoribosylamino)uracil reductase
VTSTHMRRALALAESALYLTPPNPRVGCVIVNSLGEVIGEGHTQRVGEAHAEVMALRDAAAHNQPVQGATAYVTLEPCSHEGRTGACSVALIQSGVARVIASLEDPNPLVAGKGFAALRAAGIAVEIGDGTQEAQEINIGFFNRMTTGVPWVRMKAAASLDGFTALPNGASQWITSIEARTDGHVWRARACAVLTGIGTVLADDPRLDVHAFATPRQPTLVIVDSQLETPVDAKLWSPTAPAREVWIYCASNNPQKMQALQTKGATIVCLPNANGKVNLPALMLDLGKRQINEVHVEAGFKLNGSLWREGLVDELLLYQSPQLLASGMGIANLGVFENLAQTPKLTFHSVTKIGPDVRILARKINSN